MLREGCLTWCVCLFRRDGCPMLHPRLLVTLLTLSYSSSAPATSVRAARRAQSKRKASTLSMIHPRYSASRRLFRAKALLQTRLCGSSNNWYLSSLAVSPSRAYQQPRGGIPSKSTGQAGYSQFLSILSVTSRNESKRSFFNIAVTILTFVAALCTASSSRDWPRRFLPHHHSHLRIVRSKIPTYKLLCL